MQGKQLDDNVNRKTAYALLAKAEGGIMQNSAPGRSRFLGKELGIWSRAPSRTVGRSNKEHQDHHHQQQHHHRHQQDHRRRQLQQQQQHHRQWQQPGQQL